jgi:hypothetical protein
MTDEAKQRMEAAAQLFDTAADELAAELVQGRTTAPAPAGV